MYRRWPVPPGEAHPFAAIVLMECFEDREILKRLSAVALKVTESAAEAALCGALCAQLAHLEASEQRLQYRSLALGDRAVIDEPGGARIGKGHRERFPIDQSVHRLILGKTGYRGHVDVKVINVAAARWGIGTEVQRLSGKQRV